MASNNQSNPWEDQHSQQGPPFQAHNTYQTHDPYTQQPAQGQNSTPWSQEPSQGLPPHQQAPRPSYPGREEQEAPGLPPRRTATDMALPQGQDRSHQIEVMQSYEAAGRKDEDDDNVQTLQREFPKMDGSLIAAIYGDSKSLSATREMLQALEGE